MPIIKYLFRKVTIVGVGLIGGSLGLAIKKHSLAREVVGFTQSHSSLVYALNHGVIDHGFSDMKSAFNNADLVILATPVRTIMKLLPQIARLVRRRSIITDVGSTKASIVDAAERNLSDYAFFVGGHPLAGSEKKGANYANADLFQNSVCILTPTDKTNRMAREKMKYFWTRLGAQVKIFTPQEHDQVLAFISHLPHLTAYALIDSIPVESLGYASQGLKDTTRIAASNPQLWTDICLTNHKLIVDSIDQYVKNLSVLRKAILTKNEQAILEHFQRSKSKRDGLEQK